jgi:rubrerythrin
MTKYKEAIFQAVTEIDLDGATDEDILRIAIAAEQSATNLYNRLVKSASNEDLKKVLLDISREEKVHAGEFQALLFRLDPEEEQAHDEAYEEVEELLGEDIIRVQYDFAIYQEDKIIILEKGDQIKRIF